MKARRYFSTFLAGSAWLMSAFGPTLAFGDEPLLPRVATNSATTKAKAAKASIPDIVLTAKGTLVGLVVDAQSQPLVDSEVLLKQGNQTVANVKTDSRGVFLFEDLKGGIYQITTVKQSVGVRAWTNRTAPPSAKKLAVIMQPNEKVIRAQNDLGDEGLLGSVDLGTATLVGLGIATLTVTSITLSRTNDLKSTNADLQRQLASLRSQVDSIAATVAGLTP